MFVADGWMITVFSHINTNLCQLPVLSFIWATCCMKEHDNQKLQKKWNNICLISGLFLWKAALHREWKVRTTTDGSYSPTQVVTPKRTTCSHHYVLDSLDKHLDESQHYVCPLIQFIKRQHLCPPLRGCCRRRYWLQCLLCRCGLRSPLRPPPRAHGHCQRTDHPEWGRYTPLAWSNTARWNDEHSGGLYMWNFH